MSQMLNMELELELELELGRGRGLALPLDWSDRLQQAMVRVRA